MEISEEKFGLYFSLLLGVGVALFLTYDIIITNILSAYYCNTSPNPKIKIEKKVEYPLSIYWEDNVYPGFSKQDRELMIINYLDGKHLKTMALNGDDGKIYVYHLDKPILKELKAKYSTKEWYNKGLKEYANIIMQNEKIYTKATMPKLNYTVTFNEIHLNAFASKFLYSDETKVIDNKTDKVIAYNRRYMRFFYTLQPDFVGGRYYSEAMCGERVAHLEYKIFDAYQWTDTHLGNHQRNLHEILIKRY